MKLQVGVQMTTSWCLQTRVFKSTKMRRGKNVANCSPRYPSNDETLTIASLR
eukprot:m.45536 g.45536  ORF g.45536 m.45536 type:complete len:52 (+) comp10258_c0_seq1:1894-2049(+)